VVLLVLLWNAREILAAGVGAELAGTGGQQWALASTSSNVSHNRLGD
jgi:hypothetical protein